MIYLILLLAIINGVCKGICDEIQFHNGLKDLGRFWDSDSWRDPKNKLMNAVINAWHVFDWIRNFTVLLSLCLLLGFNWWLSIILFIILYVLFWLGFTSLYDRGKRKATGKWWKIYQFIKKASD